MSPVLDSIGSVKGYGWGSFAGTVESFESIASFLPTSTSTVTFSNIPQSYASLHIRILARCSSAGQTSNLGIRFNSDSGNNYTRHAVNVFKFSGVSLSASNALSVNRVDLIQSYPGGTSLANTFVGALCDIYDYSNSSKNKTFNSFTGVSLDVNDFSQSRTMSSLWLNTSAITSLTVFDANGNNFSSGTSIALYGIKG